MAPNETEMMGNWEEYQVNAPKDRANASDPGR